MSLAEFLNQFQAVNLEGSILRSQNKKFQTPNHNLLKILNHKVQWSKIPKIPMKKISQN